jgi:alkylation response protein AidB-like acyl-CoA dehydrogenase
MDIQPRSDPVARARELGAQIAAAADEIERTQRIPEALLNRLHDSRLFRMLLPRSAGGDETAPAVYAAAIEELARHDASIAWNVFVANSSSLIAAYLEPAVNQAIFADPRSIVAWGPPNASRARAVDVGYRLTGKWDFASGCRQARWMGAHCHVLEADGALRLNHFGRPMVRTLLFPASDATLLDTWRTIGLCGTASDSYCVNDVFVSEAFSTTREDPTLCRERGPLYAFTMQCLYATGVAPWRSASRAQCCPSSLPWRRARRRVALPDLPTTPSCRPTWHARRRGLARRAPTSSRRSPRSMRVLTTWRRSR